MRIRPATGEDVDDVSALVRAAYEHYVDLIGGRPRPMLADYGRLTADEQVEVADDDGTVIGVLVTEVSDDEFVIENVAVHPDHQRRGIGRALLDHAESTAAETGHAWVRLYTHQLMTENLTIYRRRGYVEFATEPLPNGTHVVHLHKGLAPH